jgi:hypothetical protein
MVASAGQPEGGAIKASRQEAAMAQQGHDAMGRTHYLDVD